ncbi:MAG: helix-turn-helix domain-containing protein [Christensenellales bacterium]|jgi:transcriptional regulator with XRE-family HTH domain
METHIGEKIIRKRKALGLTQSELAKRAGIAQSTLSNIEKGEQRPQFDTISAICRVLGVSILELLTYEEKPSRIRFFEEAFQIGTSGSAPEVSMASRLKDFDRYLYDLFIAQTRVSDHPADAGAG